MDLKKIQEILSSPMKDDTKEYYILTEIAKDKDAIPTILKLLNQEREVKNELILDMNLELSRADTILEDTKLANRKGAGDKTTKEFALEEIRKFYDKYREYITHCFNKYNKK